MDRELKKAFKTIGRAGADAAKGAITSLARLVRKEKKENPERECRYRLVPTRTRNGEWILEMRNHGLDSKGKRYDWWSEEAMVGSIEEAEELTKLLDRAP